MADISTYLAAILSAVYGEEVRGSIHDAIELINDVSEVVMTTGTAVTSPTSSSEGFYTDSLYLNTSTFELWKCIGVNSWTSLGTLQGADGNGITDISKTATAGKVDTYTITFDDGSTETFSVTNGSDGADGADGIDGSTWYKGTALSGTGTSITGFPGKRTDFYLNSSTGMVYTCVKGGSALPPDPAEWDYVMTLTGGGGSSVTVIDNLSSTSSSDALSANQGRALNEKKQEKFASYSAGLKEEMVGPVGSQTLQLSLDLLAGSNISLVEKNGKLEINAEGGSGGSSTFAGLDDTDINNPQADQIVQYKSVGGDLKLQNVNMPQGGHTMIPNNTAITSLTSKATDNTDDDVASGYAIANWSNAEITTLIAHIDSGDDTVGAWNDAWKTDGIRTGWVWHECLYDIVSDNEVEISIDFDVAGEEVVGLYAYRVDDSVSQTIGGQTVNGGAIAIKLTSPIQNASGVDVAINLKRQRTNLVTNPTILS